MNGVRLLGLGTFMRKRNELMDCILPIPDLFLRPDRYLEFQ
jgi:hypothetical protein